MSEQPHTTPPHGHDEAHAVTDVSTHVSTDAPVDPALVESADTLHVERYEGIWIRLSVAIIVIFFLAITVAGFSAGFQIPGVYQRIDPATLFDEGSPFANPEVRELAPGRYDVHIRAQIWMFTPREIRVPVGSTVTFFVTSQDVQHGMKLTGTNINMMILPGQISRLTTTFDKPGTYNFICHEYCGQLHHTMYGQLIVEDPDAPATEAQTAAAPVQ
jgi:cytochrome c oxidase subunit 2